MAIGTVLPAKDFFAKRKRFLQLSDEDGIRRLFMTPKWQPALSAPIV